MRKLSLLLVLVAQPAFAASGPFFSLRNTDFVVSLAFLTFVGVLFYFKVPTQLGGLLDKRAAGIKSDLDEARSLREEAQSILATYERKSREVQTQADEIVANAKRDAEAAAEQAKKDLEDSIVRRLNAAEEQIGSAEKAAVKEVRDRAAAIAIAAAGDVLAKQMTASEQNARIDASIKEVAQRLH
ncbi:F0F1 ATP synthase subunit B [Rhodobacteraceae bacterium]|nr:F0F1 ATP synthase subunit B [Paracoccaceae bacterium]